MTILLWWVIGLLLRHSRISRYMVFGFLKKKSKSDDRYVRLKLKDVKPVAKDAVNLVFEQAPFNYKSGQFLTILSEINGRKVQRAYSLCTSPYLDQYPAVTVKRVINGQMSNHINDNFEIGQEIVLMRPAGNFTTDYDKDSERHIVLFGGGSGITPLYSIIRSLLNQEPKSKATLIYGNRSEEYVIFGQELKRLAQEYENFQLVQILEEAQNGSADYIGRPDASMIGEILNQIETDSNTEYFICGPEGMMSVVKSTLKEKGISDEKVRLESFVNTAESTKKSSDKGKTVQVTIELDGEQHEIEIQSSRPILEQALEAGIDMPYSCQSGLCTACRAKCHEGEVDTSEAEGLTSAELDEGYVLTCVGKALTDKLHLEMG